VTSIGFLETLKKPPLSGRAEQGREKTKSDQNNAAQAKRGGGKGKTFFGKKRQGFSFNSKKWKVV